MPRAAGVCDRTTQVRDGLIAAAGVSDCSLVTDAKLSSITYLDLNNKGITSLKAGDFAGLSRLRWLYLENNELTLDSFPAGVFAPLLVGRAPDAIGVQGNPGCPTHGSACFPPSPTVTAKSGGTERSTVRAGELVALSVSTGDYRDPLGRSFRYAWRRKSGPTVELAGASEILNLLGETTYVPPSGRATWFGVPYVSENTSATFALELSANAGQWTNTTHTNFWSKVVTEVEVTFAPPPASPDTSLSTLTVDGVNPSLDSEGNFTTTVINGVDSVTVKAVPSVQGASAVIEPADADTVASGHQINLSTGDNGVTITVTASDRTTRKAYSLSVTRESSAGVCGRTEQVRNKLVELTGAGNCMSVTAAQLSQITALDLDDQGIESLEAHDFAGLSGLRQLHLRNNRLTLDSFPGGVFAVFQRTGAQVLRNLNISGNPGCPSHGNRCFPPSPTLTVGDGTAKALTINPGSAVKVSVGLGGYRDPLGRSLEYAWERRSGPSMELRSLSDGRVMRTLVSATHSGNSARYAAKVTPAEGRWRRTVLNSFWSEAVRETPEVLFREPAPAKLQVLQDDARYVDDTVRLRLVWDPPPGATKTVTRYQYRHSAGAVLTGDPAWTDVAGEGLRRWVRFENLPNSTRYTFEVRAVYGAAPGTPGSAATLTVTTAVPSPRLSTLYPEGTAGDTSVDLFWNAIATLGGEAVTGYRIEESSDGARTWNEVVADTGSVQTTYRRTGLTRGATRLYQLRALSATRTGAYSRATWGGTRPVAPGKPTTVLTPVPQKGPAAQALIRKGHAFYILSWAPVKSGGRNVTYEFGYSASSTGWTEEEGIRADGYRFISIGGPADQVRAIRVRAVIDDTRTIDGTKMIRIVRGPWSDEAQIADDTTGAPAAFDPFSGVLRNTPLRHDGRSSFTFELHFSRDPGGLGYRDVRDELLDVMGGRITNARRSEPPSNQSWTVTVAPTQTGPVTITLPARDCSEPNAVCAGDEPLAGAATVTVDGPAFTGSFSGVPVEHFGSGTFTMEFHLSEAPRGLGWRVVRDHLFEVSGGTIARARRIGAVRNRGWELTVAPSGKGDVTLTSLATASCDDANAVCTSDGRMLEGGATATVTGPATFSVADASVDEAAGATLDFVVTLSRARTSETTVNYATSDGTATAGSDYTAASGTLTFAAGETSKTVKVTVLDDSHDDDGDETMTFTLSNPVGAVLDDDEATGTIKNTDAMPQAWIARFGRTVAEQVVDAVEARLEAPRTAGLEASLAGQPLGGAGPVADADEALERREAEDAMTALAEWLGGEDAEAREGAGFESRAVSGREVLLGSSFALTGGSAETGFGALWGRAAVSGFDGREGEPHGRRRGDVGASGGGLVARRRDGGSRGGPQPGRRELPQPGGRRRGGIDADRGLPLWALCAEPDPLALGCCGSRPGHADAGAGGRCAGRDRP